MTHPFLIYVLRRSLFGKLYDNTGCNPSLLSVEGAEAGLALLEVDVDDGLRTFEVGILEHVADCNIANSLVRATSDTEDAGYCRLTLSVANNLKVVLAQYNLSLG